jgi:AhpD family alkylhydroperoxidase
MLAASEQQFGFLPSPVAKAAGSPVLLKYLLGGFGAFDQTSLAPLEREVIAMTVAFEQECHYCMAMHSAMLAQPEHASLVQALRAGVAVADPRLEALRLFTQTMVRQRGRISAALWSGLARAGFTEAQALEIVLGVGVYLLSTLTNVVTEVELDAPFAAFHWERPVSATREAAAG